MTLKQGNCAHPSLSCYGGAALAARSPGRQEFTGTSISRSLLGQGFCLIGLKSHSSPTQAPAEPSVPGIGNLEEESVKEFACLALLDDGGAEFQRLCRPRAQLGERGLQRALGIPAGLEKAWDGPWGRTERKCPGMEELGPSRVIVVRRWKLVLCSSWFSSERRNLGRTTDMELRIKWGEDQGP